MLPPTHCLPAAEETVKSLNDPDEVSHLKQEIEQLKVELAEEKAKNSVKEVACRTSEGGTTSLVLR